MTRWPLLGLVALVLAIGGPAEAAPSANGRIAYVGPGDPTSIWVVNPDGSGNRYLVTGRQPSWSPDGLRLVYVGPHSTFGIALYLVNADGGVQRPLTASGTVGDSPDWSPDGAKIAFANLGDIYTIGVDGSGLRQLTVGEAYDQTPSWPPDGLTIAFHRYGTWLMDADGGSQRPLDVEGIVRASLRTGARSPSRTPTPSTSLVSMEPARRGVSALKDKPAAVLRGLRTARALPSSPARVSARHARAEARHAASHTREQATGSIGSRGASPSAATRPTRALLPTGISGCRSPPPARELRSEGTCSSGSF